MLDVEALGLLASPRAWRAAGLGAEHRGFGVSYLLPTTALGPRPCLLHFTTPITSPMVPRRVAGVQAGLWRLL